MGTGTQYPALTAPAIRFRSYYPHSDSAQGLVQRQPVVLLAVVVLLDLVAPADSNSRVDVFHPSMALRF